ncbi:MAG: PRC-barrel domain-containing protein [Chloroflexota bacterium]
MIKGQSIIGKPVLTRNDGEKLDSVKDLIIGTDHTHVIALLIDEGGLFGKPTVVPIENVVSYGKDVLMVDDSQSAVRADRLPAVAEALEASQKLDGKKVFSETGEEYGRIDDVYFEENGGKIVGVDVADLAHSSSPKTKAYLEVGDVISFGNDAVIISASAAARLVGPDTTAGATGSSNSDGSGAATSPDVPSGSADSLIGQSLGTDATGGGATDTSSSMARYTDTAQGGWTASQSDGGKSDPGDTSKIPETNG